MQKARIVALVAFWLWGAATSQQSSVDITAEPSHHLVFQNEYLRAFDVTVAPKASTLVHRHDHDYVFVTLGDADLVNARVGEKPAPLQLKDGETRYTPGGFAHAATNNSDQPFHNITIDLLQASTNVKRCTEACLVTVPCTTKAPCATIEPRISSDQWVMSMVTMPPGSEIGRHTHASPHLVIAVTDLDMAIDSGDSTRQAKMLLGGVSWVPARLTHAIRNNSSHTLRFVTLEFTEGRK